MTETPKALLFDLGCVVLNIQFDRCFAVWAEASGVPFNQIKERFAFDHGYADHECSRIDGSAYHRHVAHLLQVNLSFSAFKEGWNAIFCGAIKETIALLDDLHGKVPLFAFTNSNVLHRQYWSNVYAKELRFFKQIFCSSQIQLRKPNIEAYRYILKATDFTAGDLLFIDDLSENIRGAAAAGLQTFHFSEPAKSVEQLRVKLTSLLF